MEIRIEHPYANPGYEFIDATQEPECILIRAKMSDGDIIKMRYVGYTMDQAMRAFDSTFIRISDFK